MKDGVILKSLTTHVDERGFFREVICVTDDFFAEGFGQWSHSMMNTGTVKAWHIHQKQVDWWYVPAGAVKAVLAEFSGASCVHLWDWIKNPIDTIPTNIKFVEFLLGDNHPPAILRIPPGVAHGLKVLQGPAHLFYITSQVYNPDDEGRIPYDALGYDWFKQEIK